MYEPLLYLAGGSTLTWLIQQFWKRTVGTRYRTEKDCDNCETRRAVRDIRRMTQELAIKAGVPIHEALKVGYDIDKRREDGET